MRLLYPLTRVEKLLLWLSTGRHDFFKFWVVIATDSDIDWNCYRHQPFNTQDPIGGGMRYLNRRRLANITALPPQWIDEGTSRIRAICRRASSGRCDMLLHPTVFDQRYNCWRGLSRIPSLLCPG
jgi:hypothetical protein